DPGRLQAHRDDPPAAGHRRPRGPPRRARGRGPPRPLRAAARRAHGGGRGAPRPRRSLAAPEGDRRPPALNPRGVSRYSYIGRRSSRRSQPFAIRYTSHTVTKSRIANEIGMPISVKKRIAAIT